MPGEDVIMGLSPEERKRIYEEEKAKNEAEAANVAADRDVKELKPNIAALICYAGIWVAGIVFLILEKKNAFVRFHAMQSIVTFGALTILNIIFQAIPTLPTHILGWIVSALAVVLWIVLMYKAYHGERYKLPIAGDLADNFLK